MRHGATTRRWFAAALLTPLVACGSESPRLYTLDPPPGPVRRGGPRTIELRAVGIARYLERNQIVRSSEDFRIDPLTNDWWGEPLDAMLGRILVRALSERLPGSTVYLENGAISADPAATVRVNIQRMDRDRNGATVLSAQYAISRQGASIRNFSTSVAINGDGVPALVAAMSTSIGLLADQIAGSLAAG